jgi:hypothetical protein
MENNEQDNSEEVEKTYTEADIEEMKNQMKEQYEKSFDEKFNKRWGKEMRNIEKRNAKTNELISLLEQQTGKNNLDDLLALSYEQYGVERPNTTEFSDEDIQTLGRLDAKKLLDGSDYEDIEEEANRLAEIEDRTPREQAMFMELGQYLTAKKSEQKRKKELQDNGIDESVLEDAEFKNYLSKFKDDVSISEIYESYTKLKPGKEKPFSTGSLKGTNVEDKNKVKEFYTFEESKQFTRADFDKNPALWKAIQDSMTKWGKK